MSDTGRSRMYLYQTSEGYVVFGRDELRISRVNSFPDEYYYRTLDKDDIQEHCLKVRQRQPRWRFQRIRSINLRLPE